MADVDVTCASCGRKLRVSEVVDVALVACPNCGARTLTREMGADGVPVPPPETLAKEKLRLKKISTEPFIKEPEPEEEPRGKRGKREMRISPEATVTTSSGTVNLQELSERKRKELERRKAPFMVHGLSAWGVFVLLAGITTFFRYGAGRGMGILEPCLPYAWAVVLFFHVLGIVLASHDDLLHGVLATVIPGYAFYYIFQLHESFMLRAVVAGILIGFAQDGGLQIWGVVSDVAADLNAWIGSGGGGVRRVYPEM